MKPLSGRTALVTGAGGYLGRAMCMALADAGARIIANGRNGEKCEALVGELRALGHSATSAVFDVTDQSAVADFVAGLGPDEPLHILINNAAEGRGGTVETASDQEFTRSFDLVVTAAHRLTALLLPALRRARSASGDASIVNIASMYGMVSPDLRNYDSPETSNPPYYGAAKAALIQYTRYVACQLAPDGIRCNAIAPGPFPRTEVQRDMPAMVARLASRVPLGRVGQPAEIGGPVVFLASPASTFVTGIVLPVDGGWTAW